MNTREQVASALSNRFPEISLDVLSVIVDFLFDCFDVFPKGEPDTELRRQLSEAMRVIERRDRCIFDAGQILKKV